MIDSRRLPATALMTAWMILLLLAAGCGGGDDADEQALPDDAPATVSPDSQVTANQSDRHQVHEEGRFEAHWPSGCARLRTRTRSAADDPFHVLSLEVTCERVGLEETGCKVTVHMELPGGEIPTPENVTGGMAQSIATLGLEILQQDPIMRDGMEGVRAFCKERDGSRVVWLEGFLHNDMVLQTMAWGPDGRIYDDEGMVRFMRSVKLLDSEQ